MGNSEVLMHDNSVSELVKYTKAMLLLRIHELTNTEDPMKPEVLLSRAGLSPREIGELLGKNPAAVAKSIQRSGKGGQ